MQPAPPASESDIRALIAAGRYVEAERHCLARITTLESSASLEMATTIDLLIEARYLGRRLTQANSVELGERALRIKEAAFGSDDPRVATTLILAGYARAAHRRPEEARALVQRALAIRERAFGPDHLEVANAWNALAFLERTRNRFVLAAEPAEKALAIARRAEQPPGRETEAALTSIGLAARHVGDAARAVGLYEEVIAILERLHGPTHPALVFPLTELGAAYWDTGDHAGGRAMRDRALRVLELTPGSEYRLAFETMIEASRSINTGEYTDALARAQRAVTLAERATGPGSALTAGSLDILAMAHARLGIPATAAAIRTRTVTLWTAAHGADSLHTGTAWAALAESHEEAGQIDAAFEAIEHALSNAALVKEPLLFVNALQIKARLLAMRGRLEDARATLDRALGVGGTISTSTARTDMGTTLGLQARLERQAGDAERAIPLYREAIARLVVPLGETHPTVATWRTEFAGALAEAGQLADARRLLVDGEAASLDHLRLIARGLSDQAALAFAATRVSGIDLAVTLATAAPSRREAADVTPAWDLVIRGRTVILDEMAARQRAITQETANTALRDRWTTLNHARARLASLIVRGPQERPADQHQLLVERARAARDQAERDLAEASVAFAQEQQRSRAGQRDVLARLSPDATIVSYVRYTP